MNKFTHTAEHILELIERIAKEFDTEWNGDSDTYEQACTFNDCAEVIQSFKEEYE